MDRTKNETVGVVKFSIGDLITSSAKDGYLSIWTKLQPKHGKGKAAGEILVEAVIDDNDDVSINDPSFSFSFPLTLVLHL